MGNQRLIRKRQSPLFKWKNLQTPLNVGWLFLVTCQSSVEKYRPSIYHISAFECSMCLFLTRNIYIFQLWDNVFQEEGGHKNVENLIVSAISAIYFGFGKIVDSLIKIVLRGSKSYEMSSHTWKMYSNGWPLKVLDSWRLAIKSKFSIGPGTMWKIKHLDNWPERQLYRELFHPMI